jgi:hypothetical protein
VNSASRWASEAVASCLEERLTGLETARPEGGDAAVELWIIAP